MDEKLPRPPSLLAQPSYLASQVSKFGRRHLEAALAKRELALGHFAVLSALDDFGSLAQQQLAEALDLDKSNLVGWIDDLEERGIVARTKDPSDRRRNQVALTAGGRKLMSELQPAARASQQGFLDVLSASEQRTLISLLGRVLAANDADSNPAAANRSSRG
jgi:DNA-binding MarR family transcriptional regulator